MGTKCITKDCENHDDQGVGEYLHLSGKKTLFICMPCWAFLTKAERPCSQLYRNGRDVALNAGEVSSRDFEIKRGLELAIAELQKSVTQINEKKERQSREKEQLLPSPSPFPRE